MRYSGTLYVEQNNPCCARAIAACQHLSRKGMLNFQIVDITKDKKTRTKLKKKTRLVFPLFVLPILALTNVGMLGGAGMEAYFAKELRDFESPIPSTITQ